MVVVDRHSFFLITDCFGDIRKFVGSAAAAAAVFVGALDRLVGVVARLVGALAGLLVITDCFEKNLVMTRGARSW